MPSLSILNQDLMNRYWKDLSFRVTDLFHFSEKETKLFQSCNTAKLIGLLPFIAKTKTPERDSLSHLIIYLASINEVCKVFYLHEHRDDKNVIDRLRPIHNFNGGNKDIIERGMCLLALIMLEEYHRDREIDLKDQKYNPILSGIWNYEFIKDNLTNQIENVHCPEMDKIISLEYITFSNWSW